MSNSIKNLFAFALGAGIGSVVTWKLVKTKYEQRVQEEIDSVKEVFAKRQTEVEESRSKAEVAKDKPNIMEYASKLQKEGYTDYSAPSKKEDSIVVDRPYVIPPEEFGELPDYSQITLYYFADGILADGDNELVEDVEDVVGFESLNHFGEYEDDSVCVRNDRLHSDYEILLREQKYSEEIKRGPHRLED